MVHVTGLLRDFPPRKNTFPVASFSNCLHRSTSDALVLKRKFPRMNQTRPWIVPILASITLAAGCIGSRLDPAEWSASSSMASQSPSVVSIAFSDDGRRAVTSHYWVHSIDERVEVLFYPDGVMRIWERELASSFRDDRLLASRTFPTLPALRVRFPPDSTRLQLALRRNESQLVTCDSDTLQWSIEPLPLSVSVASPDGRYVAGESFDDDAESNDTVVLTVRTSGRQTMLRTEGVPHQADEFSRDGELLLTGAVRPSDDFTRFNIWETSTGRRVSQFEGRLVVTEFPRPLISPDSMKVAFLAYTPPSEMSIVRIHRTSDGSLVRERVIDDGHIWALAFSPDGSTFAVSGESSGHDESGFVRVFQTEDGKSLASINVKDTWGVTAVAFTPDGESVAAGTASGEVLIYSLDWTPPGVI